MKGTTSLIILLLLSVNLSAQKKLIEGFVCDEEQQPIPYAMIGIVGKPIGTISNEEGNFTLKVEDLYSSLDTLVISGMGFNRHAVLTSKLNESNNHFILRRNIEELPEVLVLPQTMIRKNIGRDKVSKKFYATFFSNEEIVDNDLGKEVGTILKLPKGICRLINSNFYIGRNPYKQIKLRLILYSVDKNNFPKDIIISENIIADIPIQYVGWVKIDLEPYHLIFENREKIAITLQWIDSELENKNTKYTWVGIPCAFPSLGSEVIRRESSQDAWTSTKSANPSIYLTIEERK